MLCVCGGGGGFNDKSTDTFKCLVGIVSHDAGTFIPSLYVECMSNN